MFGIGFGEILFLIMIIVIVLGPEKLPTAIRQCMKWLRQWTDFKNSMQQILEKEFELKSLKDDLNQELQKIKQLEKQLHQYLPMLPESTLQHSKVYYPIDGILLAPYRMKFYWEHISQWGCFQIKYPLKDQENQILHMVNQ